MLHGLSSYLKGPWSDMAEAAYQQLRQDGVHTTRLASPLRFARMCALLRKLRPLDHAGGTILIWRLTSEEIHTATAEAAAEVIAISELSRGMRQHQKRALATILNGAGYV